MGLKFCWGIKRTVMGYSEEEVKSLRIIDLKAVFAEFVGTTLLITIGCGVACAHGPSDGQTRLLVAMAFGVGVMAIAYGMAQHSGGQLNCAVTFSLVLGGAVPWYQGLFNCIAQMLGSILGAVILCGIFPCDADLTGSLASNMPGEGYAEWRVLIGETFGTFMLCFTVWECAVTPVGTCGKNVCLAIGAAVFVNVLILLPVDGCSLNPNRSFGPAVVSALRGCDNYVSGGLEALWMMFLGPLLGAACAAGLQWPLQPNKEVFEMTAECGGACPN
mmetsp:Transcript_27232/g.59376  ORF Transcript_27232/g.59376 Transcript_27232/m.59376 type:complete len:274 (-) Transcript_27232:68-889(-)